jgi:hypothetical protein
MFTPEDIQLTIDLSPGKERGFTFEGAKPI